MDALGGIDGHWWWLIAAVVLAIGETFAPGVFLIWIAVGAAITGIAGALVPLDLAQQFILFAAAALVSAYAGRSWYLANPVASEDDLLNDRAARLIGQTVVVERAIENGQGRVRVGDGSWPAQGPDLPVGARCTVTAARDALLFVAALPETSVPARLGNDTPRDETNGA